ncbi:MAG: 50S ribosomal protein L24 [Candidatus Heimdallarchaeota archaeon]|nr:MAG: 50S ribosomal protein L24 [Candidatus Heimdallarchaeota archaeon]
MGTKQKTRDPSKQRRRLFTAHSFQRSKMISARLSKDLREKYKVKRMPVRPGDVVYITAGDFIGTEGKVLEVDTKKRRLGIDGIAREKADKSKIMYKIDTSKVVIRRFGKVDKSRKKILERRAKMELEIDEDDISEAEAEALEEE